MACKYATVVLIDPDDSIREALAALLTTFNIPMLGFRRAEAYLASRSRRPFKCGCLLIESRLPELSSLALLRQLRQEDNALPIILLVSSITHDIAERALLCGATDVVRKPLNTDALVHRLSTILKPQHY